MITNNNWRNINFEEDLKNAIQHPLKSWSYLFFAIYPEVLDDPEIVEEIKENL